MSAPDVLTEAQERALLGRPLLEALACLRDMRGQHASSPHGGSIAPASR
jgi:hypothetical protein